MKLEQLVTDDGEYILAAAEVGHIFLVKTGKKTDSFQEIKKLSEQKVVIVGLEANCLELLSLSLIEDWCQVIDENDIYQIKYNYKDYDLSGFGWNNKITIFDLLFEVVNTRDKKVSYLITIKEAYKKLLIQNIEKFIQKGKV